MIQALTQAHFGLVDCLADLGIGILDFLLDRCRAFGHGIRFGGHSGSLEFRDRSLVLPGLAGRVFYRSVDRLRSQKGQTVSDSHHADLSACASFDHRPGFRKLFLFIGRLKIPGLSGDYSAFKICVKIVAPEPPMFCAMPILALSICVPLHSPRNCCTTSTI